MTDTDYTIPQTVTELYERLSREDLPVTHDPAGKVAHGLPYLTGETCISTLNTGPGLHAWSFKVLEKWRDTEADEIVVHGQMTLVIKTGEVMPDGTAVMHTATREQFGSKKINRSRKDNSPVDIGFDYKAATTDAIKKCATLFGVGLFLSRKFGEAFDASSEIAEPAPVQPAPRPIRPVTPVPTQRPPLVPSAWSDDEIRDTYRKLYHEVVLFPIEVDTATYEPRPGMSKNDYVERGRELREKLNAAKAAQGTPVTA